MSTVPVPQADDLNKVFGIVDLVSEGYTSAADIAQAMGVVSRQGEYYASAAEQLGLVRRDDSNEYSLTRDGANYAASKGAERVELRRHIIFKAPIMKHLAAGLQIKRPNFKRHGHLFEDTKYVADSIEELGFATETSMRRAFTIKSWMKDLNEE